MLLLTFFSENKQKNHKSSPRRGEDLEKGYHCEGLGDLSPNYLKHRNFKDSSLAYKFRMLLFAYFSKKYLNVSSCFYTLLGFRMRSTLTFLLFINCFLYAKEYKLKFSPEKSLKQLPVSQNLFSFGSEKTKKAELKKFSFNISTSEVKWEAVSDFDVLKIKDLKLRGKEGEPQLPVKVFTTTLPKNSEVLGVEIVGGKYSEIENPLKIAPAPAPQKIEESKKNISSKIMSLSPKKEIYLKDDLFPGKIVSFKSGENKKEVVVAVYFYPVQYNPLKKKTYLITSAEINLYYQTKNEEKFSESSFGETKYEECLIICPHKYLNAAQRLKNFHESMATLNTIGANVPTKIVTIEEINALHYGETDQPPLAGFPDSLALEGGFTGAGTQEDRAKIAINYNDTLAKKILSYILDCGDAPGYGDPPGYISMPNLQYIVIIGNSQDVPPSYYVYSTAGAATPIPSGYDYWVPTDYFYGLSPHDDLIPEFGVGRLPVVDLDDDLFHGWAVSTIDQTNKIITSIVSSDPGDLSGCTLVITDNASGGTAYATGRHLDIFSSSYDAGTNTLTIVLSPAARTVNIEAGDHYKIIDETDEADDIVDKIINWYSNVNYSWFKNVSLCGGNPFDERFYFGELGCLDIINASDTESDNKSYFSGMNIKKYFSTDKGYDETFNKTDVEPLLQSGSNQGFVYLLSHGSGDAFYFDDDSSISTSDLLGYSSGTTIPIVLSVACENGAFDEEIWEYNYGPSFGEAILFSGAGGIAYLGSSRTAFTNTYLSISSDEPGVISHYMDLMCEMMGLVFRRYHRGGNLLNTIFSKTQEDYYLLNADEWDKYTFRTLMEFVLLGDPALYIPQQVWEESDDYSVSDLLLTATNPRSSVPYNSWIIPVYEVNDTGTKDVVFNFQSSSPEMEVKLCDIRYDTTDDKKTMGGGNYTTNFDAVDSGPTDTINGPSLYFVRVSNIERYTTNYSREKRIYIEVVNTFTPQGDILLVDDDEYRNFIWNICPDYENYYEEVLQALGYVRADQSGTLKYKVWHVENTDGSNNPGEGRHGEITPEALNAYIGSNKLVIWFTGDDWIYSAGSPTTLLSPDQEYLADFLDKGGKLFLTGQDIGFDIGGSDFYQNYLKAIFVQDNIKLYNIDGISNDDLSNGLWNINITGGDGSNHQWYPSEIDPNVGATICFQYNQAGAGSGSWKSSGGAGIRVYNEGTGSALVYFAFGFEGIDNLNNPLNGRKVVMQRVIDWLGLPTSTGIFTATPGDTQVTLRWTLPLGQDGVLIICKEGGGYSSGVPVNGTEYNVGDTIGDGKVIYKGTGTSTTHTGLTNGNTYYYRCYSYSGSGTSITYSLIGIAFATPQAGGGGGGGGELSPPTNLIAKGTLTKVDLSWQDNSTAEDGFEIWRSLDGSDFGTEYYARVGASVTTYTDDKVESYKTYWYKVRAYKGSEFSDWSNTASTTTSAIDKPTNLVAIAGLRNVFLTWSDNSSNELGFIIERKHPTPDDTNPDFDILAYTDPDEHTYTDSGMELDSRPYYYRVKAYNAEEESDYSNEAWVTPSAFPSAEEPTNLEALPGYNSATITWTDNTTNETRYYIEIWNTIPSDVTNPYEEIETYGAVYYDETNEETINSTGRVEKSVSLYGSGPWYIRVRALHDDGGYSLYATSKTNPSQRYVSVEPFSDYPSSGGTGGGCFIATVVFGSPEAKQIEILKKFRDRYLITNYFGQKFVFWYYKYGKIFAQYIKTKPVLKTIIKFYLYPIIVFAFLVVKWVFLLCLIIIVACFKLCRIYAKCIRTS